MSLTERLPIGTVTSANVPPEPKASPPRPLRVTVIPACRDAGSITVPGLNRSVISCGDVVRTSAVLVPLLMKNGSPGRT